MTLRIHNTLTRDLEVFTPLEPGHVRMYVCGMTVYDFCHLGHARSMIAFDVVQRWLKASGFRVTYVRNVTDIDDKIIQRALVNQETIRELTTRMIDALPGVSLHQRRCQLRRATVPGLRQVVRQISGRTQRR